MFSFLEPDQPWEEPNCWGQTRFHLPLPHDRTCFLRSCCPPLPPIYRELESHLCPWCEGCQPSLPKSFSLVRSQVTREEGSRVSPQIEIFFGGEASFVTVLET